MTACALVLWYNHSVGNLQQEKNALRLVQPVFLSLLLVLYSSQRIYAKAPIRARLMLLK